MSQQVPQNLFRRSLGVAGAIALSLSSCTASPTAGETDAPASGAATSENTLQVVTTILPITQFTEAVAGDRAQVTQLLPTNTGPHDYQAKPADVQAIANADILVMNGLEMEFFLDDTIDNAENADLVIVDSSEGISTLAIGEGHDREGEAHDDEAHAEHADEHGEFDPHIWLDPKRAIEQVENIRDGLIAADPEGEADYTANAEVFISKLTALDGSIQTMLSPLEGETFVTLHDFAAYFADSYGLQFETLVDIPEENPSPEDVQRVVETVQAEGLKTILAEPQSSKGSFEAIADDLDINLSVFDPLETGEAGATQPEYYIETMRENAENLVASF